MKDAPLEKTLKRVGNVLRSKSRPDVDEHEIGHHASLIYLEAWSGVIWLPPDDAPEDQFEPEKWRTEANVKVACGTVEGIVEKARALHQAVECELDDESEKTRNLQRAFEQAPGNVHFAFLAAARQNAIAPVFSGLLNASHSVASNIINLAPHAVRLLQEYAPLPKKGRKSNIHVSTLADTVLKAYETVSGKRATRNSDHDSEFVEFLAELFDILSVTAVAETAARGAIQRRSDAAGSATKQPNN